ncbi:MAG: sulfite exporter TauE/SafE family protein [Gaiellaceae bacterium]
MTLAVVSTHLTWQLSLAGLFLGALVGMTGMGGGSLMTPLLMLVFHFDPSVAVGTDIFHGAISKSPGALRHRTFGHVHARLTFWMFLGSGPMGLLGVELTDRIGSGPGGTLSKAVGIALVIGGIGFLAKLYIKRGIQPSEAPFLLANRDRLIAFLLGASGGFVVGLTSVGSGTFFGLVMLLVFPLTAVRIVGTDVTHAAALLWVCGIAHLIHGNVDLHAVGWLLVGSIPGILIGSQLTLGIRDRPLRIAFSFILVLSGFKLVSPLPDVWTNRIIVVAVIAGGLAFGLVGFSWERRRRRTRRIQQQALAEEVSPP